MDKQPSLSNTAGIYIHIPFCKQACVYCNFHFSTSLQAKGSVLSAMHEEIALQRDYLEGRQPATVYFGGGTPSLLTADEINRIFDIINRYHNIDHLTEVTLEANPDDLTKAYLSSLQSTPVNRLSIGVQSFRDEDLLYMRRAHNAQQADYAIKSAQDAGMDNMSIDLIYGTPGLSNNAWKNNLLRTRQLGIPHFSAYALTVEERTALHHNIKTKKAAPVDEQQSAAQFEILTSYAAEIGYEHYEISNLALPGKYAVHNTNYWRGLPYLGLGPSAHSYNGSARRWNVSNNSLYAKRLLEEHSIDFEEEVLTQAQRINEYIMTSLRTMWGCDLDKITQLGDATIASDTEKNSHIFQEKKWLIQKNNNLILTDTGRLFADRIAAELFVSE